MRPSLAVGTRVAGVTVDRVIEIVAQTCRGLQAHDRGLIHRDLKPSNIFVMADDSVKITKDSWQTRKGGGFVLYNRTAPQSVVSFTVKRDFGGTFTGGQRTKWIVAYRDPRNYVRFELGGDRFLRVEMTDGRESRDEPRHTIPKVAELHVSVHVEGRRLVHQYMIPGGKDWVTFNDWTRDSALDGQFGFCRTTTRSS